MPDTQHLNEVRLDSLDEQVRGILDVPFPGSFVLAHSADIRVFEQGAGCIQQSLGNLLSGFWVVLRYEIVGLFKIL
ncbi:hypothetical protein VCB98_11250 [Gammaproteobacteria bacterium AB-CW1]|uniref:Uncharacterized protein n=1 Tax=Natronospira elongata TaxID=3110268 RepID=A0AAP6JG38_9GAMM|nr:hypothetical protein [Gammaproteobacteria bacterium AB-CW1]